MRVTDRRHFIYNNWGTLRGIVYAASEELALVEAERFTLEEGEKLRAVLARQAPSRMKAQAVLLT